MDACRILNLDIHGGAGRHLKKLADDERRLFTRQTIPLPDCGGLFEGSEVQLTAISESGLYKLIMRSDKPEARKFQDWVTREVLPAIRN